MSLSIREVAQAIGARAAGDQCIRVTGVAEPSEAERDQLALAMSPEFAECIQRGNATSAVVWEDADWKEFGLRAAIFVARPRYSMALICKLFSPAPEVVPGIDPNARVSASARIGARPSIGPNVVIASGAVIGADCVIGPNVSIGRSSCIGNNAHIHSGAQIGRDVTIGERFVLHSNAVIGSDGFSFVTEEPSTAEEVRASLGTSVRARHSVYTKVNSLGSVTIGNDVEVGACTAIDRGTISSTTIGSGTKIDNLVHIAHNVCIGSHCLICGHVGIAGSAKIGDRVVLAGMCGVSDHVKVGDDVVAGGASKIYTNVPPGQAVMGSPATKMDQNIKMYKSLRRLPRLHEQVAKLKIQVSNLTKNL